ncbi:NAD(+)/NADH kinase [Candidatus Arthromitus sp. SFB-rat-Yit]|uniref:NAD(+)/NADH kinase n=1 Tax=Candidatus Arthromitus sp. SFB-rat-Yit TaxID=1041504 RepID=UPI000227A6DC|nr:NAD(+)/NADH kinase [Candidatus Arthromitus sp. SFB-rat-Yit]BAK81115.1 ATP-NAD kinase [Candidatus Arthromitus sp. SFB-rat-Yit]
MIFGISVNTSKNNYDKIVEMIEDVLREKFDNCEVRIFLDGMNLENEKNELSFLFIVGGDGTILRSVKIIDACDLPLIGVNYGTLGFMASIELSDIERAIDQIKNNEYYIEKRLMIEACIEGFCNEKHIALNDIVITKLPISRLLKFNIFIDGNYYNSFSGDGLIISTPTGSTAYSLSAGGPIVSPDVESIIITPICPHSLNAKSLVISPQSIISLEIDGVDDNSYVIVDGRSQKMILNNKILKIQKCKRYCSLVRFNFYDYYNVLREKLINRI